MGVGEGQGDTPSSRTQAFLIADIRGYSRFTTDRGAAAAATLAATFVGVGRDAIAARSGKALALRGDEILASFPTPAAAVRAALDLQAACREATAESPNFPLDVGVGLDVGDAVAVDGAYHGAAINLAARLCARAGAGQVLVTERIATALRGESDLRFASEGTATLKGFPGLIEIFSAGSVFDIETRWAPGPPTPLPAALNDRAPMAGREPDLDWLRGVWRQARRGRGRVVLLTGAAGIGKTRLAAALGAYACDTGSPVHYAGTGGGGRGGALTAVVDARTSSRSGVWILDNLDLHAEAVAALETSVTSIASRPVLVVGICRDASRDRTLSALADEVSRTDGGVRELGPLDLDGVRSVARSYTDDIDDLPAESILRASGGVPAAIHEMVGEWAGAEARRRLVAAAEFLAEGRSRQLSGLRFADDVIAANLRRIFDIGRAVGAARSDAAESPYKGLNPFDESDAEWFFGREQLVGEMAARTVGSRLMAVAGASGTGKSSAVLAGLVPSLKAGLLPGSERWNYAVLRPGASAVAALDASLESLTDLAGSADTRLVLVVDQFEEIFTVMGADDRDALLRRLIRLAALPPPTADFDAVAILTVRADYVGHCAPYPELADLVAANLVLVGPMTGDELRRAIEAPAAKLGVHLESRLVDALVEEVVGEPGGLPLLSTALVELWQARQGQWIRFKDYRELGGVRTAVARLAENSYEYMNAEQRSAARTILLRLVDVGNGEPAVRRRVPISEFELYHDQTLTDALALLVRDRLLTRNDDQVEVAHEALIREWPRLSAWLEEDSAGRQLRSHITQSARQWDERGRDPSDLYQGARLSSALDWWNEHEASLNAVEREFLTESREASQRQLERQRRINRRLRLLLVATASFLVLALVAGLFALAQRNDARAAQKSAERQALRSDAERVGALAQTESNLDLSLLLAVAGVKLDDRPETQGDLLAALQRTSSVYRFLRPSTNAITAMAISPDGRWMATGDSGGMVRFEDLDTWTQGGPAVQLPGPVPPTGLTFSPDGRTLAVAAGKGTTAQVFAIDVATRTRRLLGTWNEGIPPIPNGSTTLAFSPDGSELAVGLANWPKGNLISPVSEQVLLLDASTGKVKWQRPYVVRKGQLEVQVGFTRSGTLVTSAQGGTTDLWNARTGTVVRTFPTGGRFALSPDGRQAAIAVNTTSGITFTTSVEILDLTTGHRQTLQAVPSSTWMATLQYTPNGDDVVGGSLDGDVRVWRVSSGAIVATYNSGAGGRTQVAVEPSGRLALSGADDGSVIAWDLSGRQTVDRTFAWSRPANGCANSPCAVVNPAGTVMATDEFDGTVDLINLRTLTWYATLPGTAGRLANGLAFTAGGLLVTGDLGGNVTFWNIATRRIVRRLRVPDPVYDVSLDPDGRQLAVLMQRNGSASAKVDVLDLATGASIRTYAVPGGSGGLAYSPDGKALVALGCCSRGSTVEIWDTRSGRALPEPKVSGEPQSIAFSPTAPVLGIGTADGKIYQWNTAKAAPVGTPLTVAASNVLQFAYSPHGNLLAAALRDGTTRLIDLASGQQLGKPFPVEGGNYTSPLFTADDDLLIVYTGSALEWPTSVATWERAACRLAGRDMTRAEWAGVLPNRPYRHVCPG